MTRDAILKTKPAWAAVMEAYRPRPDVMERIRSFVKPLAFEMVFNLESGDCRDVAGRFFRLQDGLDANLVTAKLIAVSPDLKHPAEEILSRFVETLPTLIIRVDDYELGRIVGVPSDSLEEAVDAVLATWIDPAGINFNDRESLRGFKHNTLPIPCWPCHLQGHGRGRS
jgi:hypothetical protein